MNEREYNAAEGIRRSDLWRMNDSPEKFKYFLDHPIEQTPAMAFGSACHKWVLEGTEFWNEYAVAPNVDGRTKEGKEIKARFAEENAGKNIITNDDFGIMDDMSAALHGCQLADKLIYVKGETEVPFFCDIFKMGYYMQAAMYTEGVMRAKKLRKRPGFMFVAQEKKAPYSVNVIEVSEEVMNAGIAKFHELMDKYHQCKVLDQWPGYLNGNIPNDSYVPTWMENEMEDEF